jgi:hypothetical protein
MEVRPKNKMTVRKEAAATGQKLNDDSKAVNSTANGMSSSTRRAKAGANKTTGFALLATIPGSPKVASSPAASIRQKASTRDKAEAEKKSAPQVDEDKLRREHELDARVAFILSDEPPVPPRQPAPTNEDAIAARVS